MVALPPATSQVCHLPRITSEAISQGHSEHLQNWASSPSSRFPQNWGENGWDFLPISTAGRTRHKAQDGERPQGRGLPWR